MSNHIASNAPNAQTFSGSPRLVQFFVILSFPFYAGARVAVKVVEESAKKAIHLAGKVLNFCEKVYDVCTRVYNWLAPKVWHNVIVPYVIKPVNRFIIIPVVTIITMLYDMFTALTLQTYYITRSVFVSLSRIF